MKLNKNADLDKYRYSGYDIEFDARAQFSLSDGSWDKNVIIFGVDNSSSVHFDHKKKNILVFDEGPTRGLNDVTVTAETKYPNNFTYSGKSFVSSLHYNGSNSFVFVNAVKCINSEQKI